MSATLFLVLGFLAFAHAFEIRGDNGTICLCAPVKDVSGWLKTYEIGTVIAVTIMAMLALFGIGYVAIVVFRRWRRKSQTASKVPLAA